MSSQNPNLSREPIVMTVMTVVFIFLKFRIRMPTEGDKFAVGLVTPATGVHPSYGRHECPACCFADPAPRFCCFEFCRQDGVGAPNRAGATLRRATRRCPVRSDSGTGGAGCRRAGDRSAHLPRQSGAPQGSATKQSFVASGPGDRFTPLTGFQGSSGSRSIGTHLRRLLEHDKSWPLEEFSFLVSNSIRFI